MPCLFLNPPPVKKDSAFPIDGKAEKGRGPGLFFTLVRPRWGGVGADMGREAGEGRRRKADSPAPSSFLYSVYLGEKVNNKIKK